MLKLFWNRGDMKIHQRLDLLRCCMVGEDLLSDHVWSGSATLRLVPDAIVIFHGGKTRNVSDPVVVPFIMCRRTALL